MAGKPTYDKAWLNRIAAGDERAYQELYSTYKNNIYSAALVYLRDEDEAIEVTQRIFVRFWEKRRNFAQIESLDEYIMATTRYAIYDYLRYLYRQLKLIENSRALYSDKTEDVNKEMDVKALTNLWQRIIEQLPPQQRKIYELVEVQGTRLEEAAARLELGKETVKAHLKTARRFVRQQMSRELNDSRSARHLFMFFQLFF